MTAVADRVLEKLYPPEDPYLRDPVGWVRDRAGEHLWSKQAEILESVCENRYTAVQSCHDTGKSYTASRAMAWWQDSRPVGEAFVVSTAPTATQVEAILWRELGKVHRSASLKGRITGGQVPMWKHGQEIVGYGRKPQDLTSKEEAAAAFSGIHARWVLVVIDEAGGIPAWLWDAVDTLLTNESARVLAIGNPDDAASRFEKVCRPGSGWNTIHIGAADTPAFTGEYVPDYVSEQLISKTWVEERKRRWGEKSSLYVAKVLGQFPDVSDSQLFPRSWLRKAEETDLPGLVPGRLGVDVARGGEDETAIYRNRGGQIRLLKTYATNDTMELANEVGQILNKHGGAVKANIDVVGVGAGVYDRLVELGHRGVGDFNSSHRPDRPDRFVNKRAEVYWSLREACRDGEVDLDPHDEDLLNQLLSIKFKVTPNGRIQIESKEEMAKRGVSSPDRADAVSMAWARVGTPTSRESVDSEHAPLTAGLLEARF